MRMTPLTLTTNGTDLLTVANKPNDAPFYMATISASGTFGSGTLTLYMSPDAGTTKIALTDSNGVAASFTAAGARNVVLGAGAKNSDNIYLYSSLAGASTPSITITVFDNRG